MKSSFKCSIGALTVLLGVLVGTAPSAFAKGPVKIGFLGPYVGVYAKVGQDMENGFRLGLEQIGYSAGGRQITVIVEDTEAKPELGPTKARKLIENDKVDLLAGVAHSGVALAIRDIVTNSKTPLVITNAGEPSLTSTLKSPYIFRVSFANGQQDLAGGWYAYKKLGFKRVIVIAPDYSAGHDKANGFMKYFKQLGGQVVEEIYPPLTTNDFAPYLTKISAKAKSIDAVWVFFAGSGAIRLINQYNEYGLKGAVPLFAVGDTVDDAFLPSMSDASLGIKNYSQYADSLKTPKNQEFVQAYLAKYKDYPSMYAEQSYIGARAIAMALDAVHGNVEDTEAFLAALRKVMFDAPQGPFRFDPDHNAVFPVYMREVRKVEGRYVNVVLDTMPNIDQNWSPEKMK